MRSHAPVPPLSHTRAPARGNCPDGSSHDSLEFLVLELALACLEGAALGRAVMVLQEAADDSEALASDALAKASAPDAGWAAANLALESAAALARVERAELAAASRWAAHLVESRELARHALDVAAERSRTPSRPTRRRLDSSN